MHRGQKLVLRAEQLLESKIDFQFQQDTEEKKRDLSKKEAWAAAPSGSEDKCVLRGFIAVSKDCISRRSSGKGLQVIG